MRFAVCRRCPKSYHRKCLPREIVFEKKAGDVEEENVIIRAWEDLLPNRVLIYCTKHEIVESIGTPIRDHVKFPDVKEKKTTIVKRKTGFDEKKRKWTTESFLDREKSVTKKRNLSSEEFRRGQTAPTLSRQKLKLPFPAKVGGSKTSEKVPSRLDISRQVKVNSSLKKEIKTSVAEGKKSSLGDQLFDYMKGSEQVKSGKQGKPDGECNSATVNPASKKLSSEEPSLDAASERRLLALMKDAASSITLEDVIRKHKVPSTHAFSSKNVVERNITLGKVEGSVEAIRTALRKLEEGCSIEDSEAVCAPEILNQIFKWKNKLKVYLAPFLHGMRYTSFGRHFTKVEKLEEIADRLHWYVKNGDTIVDFCCGANDFSIIMNKKLEETGKKCFYKNYDFIQPKNDFNFEKRDWMTVQPKELPSGSHLIMGLNPPFGVKASLANKFIDKALEFNPKILILIVPPETQRLNEKNSPYDLIWKDEQFLSGKSFYLPGSVDGNDKQLEQWNVRPPPLYLWSRPDWSAENKAIAEVHGHNSASQGFMEEDHSDCLNPDNSVVNDEHYGQTLVQMDDDPIKTDSPKDVAGGSVAMQVLEGSCKISVDRDGHVSPRHGKNHIEEISGKLQCGGREEHRSGMLENSSEKKLDGVKVSGSEIRKEMLTHTEPAEKGNQHSEPSNSGSNMEIETTDSGTHANVADDTGRSFAMSSDEAYSSLPRRWSTAANSGSGYRATNVEQLFVGHMRERSDRLGYGPYLNQVEYPFRRESDIRSQVRLYGQPDSDPYSSFLVGQNPVSGQIGSYPSTYGHTHFGSAAGSSYRSNTSAMQRYAPRLDELNHLRMGALGPEPSLGYDPHVFSSNVPFDPRAPRPGQHGGPMGFAPGPHQSYSSQNSAGWLNE
ncbi:unnamed protein product [Prunus armeniaca]